MNLQSQGTQDAFYLRKHKESGLVERSFFIEKHNDLSGVGGSGIKIYCQDEGQARFT